MIRQIWPRRCRQGKADMGRPGHPEAARAALVLAGIAQRRVLLDVEPLDRLGVKIIVGAKAGRAYAVDRTEVIDLVDVAGHAERPHDLAGLIADELAAALQEQRPVRQLGEGLHEGRLLLGLLQDLAGRAIERERPARLAVGDLEAQQRGSVLLLEGLYP